MSQPNLHDDSETQSQHLFLKKEMDVCMLAGGRNHWKGRKEEEAKDGDK